MLSNRLFNVLIVLALLGVILLTAGEVAATAAVVSQANSYATVCASLPSRSSIHTEYVKERGAWVAYTEDGPAGVDGGLIHLLSDRVECSK